MPRVIYKNAEGKRLQGWTTIIGDNLAWNKRQLMIWANNIGLEGKKLSEYTQAMDIGTVTHQMVEADLKGIKFDTKYIAKEILDKAENGFLAWLEWKSQVQFELLKSECSLVSETWQFGGTIDIVALVKGLPAIIDIKTGDTYPDHLIQIRGYAELWNDNFPEQKIQSYYLLRLGKEDGSFSYHYHPQLDDYWEIAKLLLELNKFKKKVD